MRSTSAAPVCTGARFIGNAPNFTTDVVNASGLASATNGRQGRAHRDRRRRRVSVSGTIAAPGGSGVRGGDVSIRAGGNVGPAVRAPSSPRAAATTRRRLVNIWADNDAISRKGALVDASAGASGDGGFVSSAQRRPSNSLVASSVPTGTGGGGLGGGTDRPPTSWSAPTSCAVPAVTAACRSALPPLVRTSRCSPTARSPSATNVTVSTRSVAGTAADHATGPSTGASGNLTLEAGSISLKSGGRLAAADGGHAGGDVTLKATRNWTGEAKVSVDNATITGRNVSLTANATYNDSLLLLAAGRRAGDGVDHRHQVGRITASGTLDLKATSLIDVSSSGLSPLGNIVATSVATVDVTGASQLSAGGNTTRSPPVPTVTSGPRRVASPTHAAGRAGVAINVVVGTAKTHVSVQVRSPRPAARST